MLIYLNQRRGQGFRRRLGQSIVEYAVLSAVVIGAMLSIQVYLKRGLQGRLKQSADDIGDQYSAGNTNIIKSTVSRSATRDTYGIAAGGGAAQGVSRSALLENENTRTVEQAVIVNTAQEYWGNDGGGAAGGGAAGGGAAQQAAVQ